MSTAAALQGDHAFFPPSRPLSLDCHGFSCPASKSEHCLYVFLLQLILHSERMYFSVFNAGIQGCISAENEDHAPVVIHNCNTKDLASQDFTVDPFSNGRTSTPLKIFNDKVRASYCVFRSHKPRDSVLGLLTTRHQMVPGWKSRPACPVSSLRTGLRAWLPIFSWTAQTNASTSPTEKLRIIPSFKSGPVPMIIPTSNGWTHPIRTRRSPPFSRPPFE